MPNSDRRQTERYLAIAYTAWRVLKERVVCLFVFR